MRYIIADLLFSECHW